MLDERQKKELKRKYKNFCMEEEQNTKLTKLQELHFKIAKKTKPPTEYYDISNILRTDADYFVIWGGRNAGKSWSVTDMCLWEAYTGCDWLTWKDTGEFVEKKRYQFAYVRRQKEIELDVVNIERYFAEADVSKITCGEYDTILVGTGKVLYFGKHTTTVNSEGEEIPKIVKGKKIGACFSLSTARKFKSIKEPFIGNLIVEEFIVEEGEQYNYNELDALNSLASTIRREDRIRIFCIGNNNKALYSPCLDEWRIDLRQFEPGEIKIFKYPERDNKTGEIIEKKIAVERAKDNLGHQVQQLVGSSVSMIEGNGFIRNNCFHLPEGKIRQDYEEALYKIFYKDRNFYFIIELLSDEEGFPFVYIYPTHEMRQLDDIDRIVTDRFTTNPIASANLSDRIAPGDDVVLSLFGQGKVCYASDKVGTEFTECVLSIKSKI